MRRRTRIYVEGQEENGLRVRGEGRKRLEVTESDEICSSCISLCLSFLAFKLSTVPRQASSLMYSPLFTQGGSPEYTIQSSFKSVIYLLTWFFKFYFYFALYLSVTLQLLVFTNEPRVPGAQVPPYCTFLDTQCLSMTGSQNVLKYVFMG